MTIRHMMYRPVLGTAISSAATTRPPTSDAARMMCQTLTGMRLGIWV